MVQKIIGLIFIAIPFIAVGVYIIMTSGFEELLIIIGLCVAIMIPIAIGAFLLMW